MHNGSCEATLRKESGTYLSQKPTNITEIDEVHLNCDCIDGSVVNGVRERILFSLAIDKPPRHKMYKEPRIELFKKAQQIDFVSYHFLI